MSQILSALTRRRRAIICRLSFVGHCFPKSTLKMLLWHLCFFPGSNPDYKPEIVTYPYVDFGKQTHWQHSVYYLFRRCFCNGLFYFPNTGDLKVSKQRLLSAHLPFLPVSISEREKMAYLSSCISFDSPLMVSQLFEYFQIHESSPCVAGDREMSILCVFAV